MQFYFKLCASLVCGSSTATTANVVVGANGVSSAKRGLVRAVSLSPRESWQRRQRIQFTYLEEIRDIVPTSGPSSLADPYVLVSCAGRSQRTEIVRSQNNVNFDRMFVFSDIRLTADEFERQNIHVQVFNANVIFRNELIGQYSYGFKKVWSQPEPSQHQINRRWVVLINRMRLKQNKAICLLP